MKQLIIGIVACAALLCSCHENMEKRAQREAREYTEKYCPTPEELNPNTRFIHNKFVEAVRNSEAVATYLKENKINSAFQGDYYLLKELLDAIRQSELYNKYMNAEVATFRDDCEFWRQALKTIVFPSDALAEAMENKSVYWNDDLAIMGTFTL